MPGEVETRPRTTTEPFLPTRVVSPELVLVDQELAAWARLRLREDVVAAEAARRTGEAGAPVPGRHPEDVDAGGGTVASQPSERSRVPRFVYVVALAALLAGLAAILRASTHSSSRRAPATEAAPRTPRNTVTPGSSGIAFAWPRVLEARYYTFSLFRGPTTIFRSRLAGRGRLVLPRSWTYEGRSFTLADGVYHWRVLAFFGESAGRPPKTVVAAPLVVERRP